MHRVLAPGGHVGFTSWIHHAAFETIRSAGLPYTDIQGPWTHAPLLRSNLSSIGFTPSSILIEEHNFVLPMRVDMCVDLMKVIHGTLWEGDGRQGQVYEKYLEKVGGQEGLLKLGFEGLVVTATKA